MHKESNIQSSSDHFSTERLSKNKSKTPKNRDSRKFTKTDSSPLSKLEDQHDSYFRSNRLSSPISLTAPKKRERYVKQDDKVSIGPSNGTTLSNEKLNYDSITNILEQENKNLKDQNRFLLEKIKKMQGREKKLKETLDKAKKYKQLYQKAKVQLDIAKEECEANKLTAKEMKKVAEMGLHQLKQKVSTIYQQEPSESSENFSFQNGNRENSPSHQ